MFYIVFYFSYCIQAICWSSCCWTISEKSWFVEWTSANFNDESVNVLPGLRFIFKWNCWLLEVLFSNHTTEFVLEIWSTLIVFRCKSKYTVIVFLLQVMIFRSKSGLFTCLLKYYGYYFRLLCLPEITIKHSCYAMKPFSHLLLTYLPLPPSITPRLPGNSVLSAAHSWTRRLKS